MVNGYGIMEGSQIDLMVCEGKNLPPMNVNGSADSFVVIYVDNE